MKSVRITIKKEEIDAIYEAIDFISQNADWADDYEPFEIMQNRLRAIWEKAIKETNK